MGVSIKYELEQRAASQGASVRLTKNTTIMNMAETLEPEICRALPAVLTPERFTRMALSPINNTPELAKCTPTSFIAVLLNTAQLGLEPNTPLGRAYLIPYKNEGELECQFQLGCKGLIDLAYWTEQIQIIQVQVVREFDSFEYQYGLDSKLVRKLGEGVRGGITHVYGLFKLSNSGYGFEISDGTEMDTFVAQYSKSFGSKYSPWAEGHKSMAKKTAIKRVLKYAPTSSDFQRALSMGEVIKTGIAVDMSKVRNECLPGGAGSEAA